MKPALQTLVLAALLYCPLAQAGTIPVRPEPADSLEKALAEAKEGDVLLLAAGVYRGSFSVGTGITLKGAGDRESEVRGTDYATFELAGERIRIQNLAVTGGTNTRRAVSGHFCSVRIENCRFDGIAEAVALRGCPLSDVICCTFKNCGIGVRAIGRSSPTVWGCRFEGGNWGVFCMDGTPYVRNCLFHAQRRQGVGLFRTMGAIVRNNLFLDASQNGVFTGRGFGGSIRNNIFHACGNAAVAGENCVTHNILSRIPNPPVQDGAGTPLKDSDQTNQVADLSIALDEQGRVKIPETPGMAKGIRDAWQARGAAARIGFETPGFQPGSAVHLSSAPPARFTEPYVVNGVAEEYACLAMWEMQPRRQSLTSSDGKHCDEIEAMQGTKTVLLRFDIHRFFGESDMDSR